MASKVFDKSIHDAMELRISMLNEFSAHFSRVHSHNSMEKTRRNEVLGSLIIGCGQWMKHQKKEFN